MVAERLSLFAALLIPAFADAAPTAVTERLAREETARCRPAVDVFCRNIHVSCSGRSSIPTAPFELQIRNGRARLAQSGSVVAVDDTAPIEWAVGRAYFIVRLQPRPGYLKILADGTYSQRIYVGETAYMSYGRCE